jgi:hypothetical protein
MDLRFGTWNIRSRCRVEPLKTVESELAKYNFRLVAVQEVRWVYIILVRKTEGKRPLGRPWHRWKDNIRTCIREIRPEGVDWMHLAQNRHQFRSLVNTMMNLWFP